MRTLARNLRDAAGCALAWRLHRDFEWDWQHGDCEAWCPNLDGARADEWQRLAETEAREHLATAKQLIEAQAERDAARAEALHLRQALNERNVL
jgi:inactivated superfamily I helicase